MPLTQAETAQLRRDFEAEDGTFLGLACAGRFDAAALHLFSERMVAACAACESEVVVERWLAEGFYAADRYLDRYLPPSLGLDAARQAALQEHFMLLAGWFFTGACPFNSPASFREELERAFPVPIPL